MIPATSCFIIALLRQHLIQMRQPTDVVVFGSGHTVRRLAVGFADLVSSTALAQQLSLGELGAAISDFERIATDIVARHDGRVIKVVGDEIMFTAPTAASACDIGLALTRDVAKHPPLGTVRVGIASGDVLNHDGDYYGPVVNLASRATKHANPGTVAVSETIRSEITSQRERFHIEPIGSFRLRGVAGRTPLSRVDRRHNPQQQGDPAFRESESGTSGRAK